MKHFKNNWRKIFEDYPPTLIVGVIILLFVFIVGLITSLEPIKEGTENDQKQESEEKEFVPILHVFDGDTFSVEIDGETEMVRAIGIDAPETGEKYTDQECFAKQSKERAIEILGGKEVYLEEDSTQENRDRYDRLLRYVWLEDGTFFNKLMIEGGFAEEYTYQDVKYQQQSDFLTAEKEARENEVGLWGFCVVMTCIGEGNSYSDLSHITGEEPKACCEGLENRIFYSLINGKCDRSEDAQVCIDCPNGKCGEGEDKCNCPEDCTE